jgi:hypothetical protein
MEKVVSQIPLKKIWKNELPLQFERGNYLSKQELTDFLSEEVLEFVIADMNEKLMWFNRDEFLSLWKKDVKNHLANSSRFSLEEFENNYCYLASVWKLDEKKIIVLEKYH